LVLPKEFNEPRPVSWFPDSTDLVFVEWSEGNEHARSIWKLSILGGSPQKLMDDAYEAAVSPDGSRIAFVRGAVGVSGYCRLDLDCRYALGSEIWTMGPDGAEPRKILEANAEDHYGPPAWSSDGHYIVYVRLHGTAATNQFFIETRSLQTGKSAVIYSEPRFNREAEMLNWQPVVCWTRDGRLLNPV